MMKNKIIRSISDIDMEIELKKQQLSMQKMVIRQDIRDVFEFPASIAAAMAAFRKLFSK